MLAEQVRSDLVETRHDGAVAVVDSSGDLVAAHGDIDRTFYFRSAAKPFQAAVSQASGAGMLPEQLALACASHDGEPVQVALAETILVAAGLGEGDLGCPPDWPIKASARQRLIAAGESGPRRIWHNCSGKHAAMLAGAVAAGWDPASYLDPAHPLQVRILDLIEEVSGNVIPVGVDGCGAPVFRTSTRRLARSFSYLAVASELREVFAVMHAYPALVSGVGNVDASIATHLDAVAKRGAAGVLGVALRGRLGIGVKCWDGSGLVAGIGAIAALEQIGALTQLAAERLRPHSHPLVKGGGRPVGRFEPRLELRWQ
ncbi:MAG: asparaginase [Acidimicrobiia bacterium]